MARRLGRRGVELAGRGDTSVVRGVLGRSGVRTTARVYAQTRGGVVMVLGGGVWRHAQTEGEAAVGRGCGRVVVLGRGAALVVVAPVEATRALLEVRVHRDSEYLGSLALEQLTEENNPRAEVALVRGKISWVCVFYLKFTTGVRVAAPVSKARETRKEALEHQGA